jgi:putative hemolysin
MQLFRVAPVEGMAQFPEGTLHSMRIRTLATISIGLLSAACQGSYSQNTPSAAGPAYGNMSLSASAACTDYGFRAGTTSFDQCVAQERQARAAGRVNRDYAAAQLSADARAACSSYGLVAATASYDRCVSREVDARSWRAEAAAPATSYSTDQYGYRVDAQGYRVDAYGHRIAAQGPYTQAGTQAYAGQAVPPYRLDQYNNRVDAEGYRVDSTGQRMPVQGPYYSSAPQAYSSQTVSRDEFGYRYDAQGNRIDATGRIVAVPANRY